MTRTFARTTSSVFLSRSSPERRRWPLRSSCPTIVPSIPLRRGARAGIAASRLEGHPPRAASPSVPARNSRRERSVTPPILHVLASARMTPKTQDPAEVAARTLVHLRRCFHAIRAQSAGFESEIDVTGPQLWALHAVAGEPEGMTLTAIAKKLVLHKANAGRLVDRLREKKLVACTRPDHDKRLTIVT